MATNAIPPMTHELGRYWKQPDASAILLDDTHALMTHRTFAALEEYSASIPSGAYEGKMWKRHNGAFDGAFLKAGGKPKWLLCWYGLAKDPEKVSVNTRQILLVT